jgi:hypothetical protein
MIVLPEMSSGAPGLREHEDYATGLRNFAELDGVAGRPSDDEQPVRWA